MLVVLANVLLVEAYASARFAPDSLHQGDPGSGQVPEAVRDGGPIIDATGGQPRSYRLPARTIALTFDDGPDPRWTPQILRILREHDVQATFFVLGSQVSRHPQLTRQIVMDGHELGVHTFTHPRLAGVPRWRRTLEYSQTQMAMAHAGGVRSSLLRLPYSSRADALDGASWQLVREAGGQGYLAVVNDIDSRDWARPGVPAIVRAATPPGEQGAVTLFHDAGGDRSQTVAALTRFIPMMKARGYRFTTVSGGLDRALTQVDLPVANPRAGPVEVWRGRVLGWTVLLADATLRVLWLLLITVGVLTLLRTLLLFAFAVRHARRRRARTWSWGPPVTEPVSVIVPAYNERKTIGSTVRSLASGDHPGEVIVVDDASTDGTGDIVASLRLPDVRLVRVPPGGKAVALNTGLALARHNLVVMVDADTTVEPGAIRRLVQPFADSQVGAVAGNAKVGNRRGLLGRWQHIEYVIGFNLDRRLYEIFGCIPTVPGAIGAFRRSVVRELGGLSQDTLAEDTDLTMAVHRAGWRVVYEDTARGWTEAPVTLGDLWRQRYRWSYGTMQAMWKHRRALIESGPSGRFGRGGLPFVAMFSVILPLLAPVLDILGVYGIFFLDRAEMAIAWLAVLAIQTVTAVLAFRLDGESLRPLWVLPLQQFAYRQLMYLVLLQSAVTALTGGQLRWQKVRRTGEAAAAAGV